MRGQVRKPPQKVSKKPAIGLEWNVLMSVPVFPQELPEDAAQHLSKSPKGKRAIPGTRGGTGCHPRAQSLFP